MPLPSPGDLPDPGIEPWSPALEADALTSEPPGKPKVTLTAVKNFKMHSGSNKAGYFPVPGIEPGSPTLQADALTSEPPGKPGVRVGQ